MYRVTLTFIFVFLIAFIEGQNPTLSAETVDWEQASWIGFTKDNRQEKWSGRELKKHNQTESQIGRSYPSSLLRKTFHISKKIASAQVAICGLGLYELYMNGEKVGDRVLDPAQTTYNKRAFYVEHDVSKLLQHGDNAIGVMLGNGFYGQNIALAPGLRYGEPRATLILKIKYKDGSFLNVVSDGDWKASNSPIVFDNIYLGETYDARQEQDRWAHSDFDDSDWNAVELMDAPTKKMVKQEMEPMRKIRSLVPIAVFPSEKGWILDMGQNMTGWLQIKVNEAKGSAIKMSFAELLMPDGRNIDPASTGVHVTGATQTDVYICRGKVNEQWEPRFTYHGFRYVQIEGLSQKPDLKNFTGWLVHTDAERIGNFECSDPLINKFYNTSIWTIEDNLQGLLSDCPHRERCAWMGDIYAVAEAASYNFDLEKLWRKTSADMQTVVGSAPPHKTDSLPRDPRAPCNIAVGKRLCLQARPDWGAATVMVPWFSYVHYGDLSIIEKAWPIMVGWIDYLNEKVQKNGIIQQGYGDWCPPGSNAKMDTPPSLTSTALYYQSLMAMEKMAAILGKELEVKEYSRMALEVKKAFNLKFYNSETGGFGSQTANSFAMQCGLVPQDKQQKVADKLADLIMKKNNGHYTTGIFGHRPLYTVLNNFGHGDVTRHLWTIIDYPSLGFMTEKHDLKTWPEVPFDWPEGQRYRRNSFNHPMHSGFAATFHESLGGIRPDAEQPGFKHFFLRPCFLPDLDWVNVSLRSPQGLISSSWKRKNGTVSWSVVVPKGSSSSVRLDPYSKEQIKLNGNSVKSNCFHLESGTHMIKVKVKG